LQIRELWFCIPALACLWQEVEGMISLFRILSIYIAILCVLVLSGPVCAGPVVVNFDDAVGNEIEITSRYAGLGITLNAIDNPYPLYGIYPAPSVLPAVLGGVTTWTDGFESATSATQVAVAAATSQTGQAGNGGILISFAFDVSFVSLVGNDKILTGDDDSVTLTAYDASGNKIGSVYSTVNRPDDDPYDFNYFDRTDASINFPGMRYVAFNHTDSSQGFYTIDDLTFVPAVATPEPATVILLGFALAGIAVIGRRQN
jgi:hypothetical protein